MTTKAYFSLRDQVLERDKYTCQICGEKVKKLDVHHVIPKRRNGFDSINNLIAVCKPCHGLVELYKIKPYKKSTQIKVADDIYDRLSKLGNLKTTYNDVIKYLLDIHDNVKVKKKK